MKRPMIWLVGVLLCAACVATVLAWGMVQGWW
jgi:hypothetical protein